VRVERACLGAAGNEERAPPPAKPRRVQRTHDHTPNPHPDSLSAAQTRQQVAKAFVIHLHVRRADAPGPAARLQPAKQGLHCAGDDAG